MIMAKKNDNDDDGNKFNEMGHFNGLLAETSERE